MILSILTSVWAVGWCLRGICIGNSSRFSGILEGLNLITVLITESNRSWFSHWMLTPVSPHTTYDVLHCAAAVEWLMEARLRAHTSIPLIMECGWMARTPVHELDRVGALLEPFFRIRTG
ncbi:hypothetical protein BKA93DRAFT_124205 [Sparassis latifolia]